MVAHAKKKTQFGKAEKVKPRGHGRLRCSKRNVATLACGLATAASLPVADGVPKPRLRGSLRAERDMHQNKDSTQQGNHPAKTSFVSLGDDIADSAAARCLTIFPKAKAVGEGVAEDVRTPAQKGLALKFKEAAKYAPFCKAGEYIVKAFAKSLPQSHVGDNIGVENDKMGEAVTKFGADQQAMDEMCTSEFTQLVGKAKDQGKKNDYSTDGKRLAKCQAFSVDIEIFNEWEGKTEDSAKKAAIGTKIKTELGGVTEDTTGAFDAVAHCKTQFGELKKKAKADEKKNTSAATIETECKRITGDDPVAKKDTEDDKKTGIDAGIKKYLELEGTGDGGAGAPDKKPEGSGPCC